VSGATTNEADADAAARAAHEEGMAAFTARDLPAAHGAFERAHRRDPRHPVYMSWYGVTLVLVEKNSNLGVLLVDQALRLAGPDPELLLNSARIHLALNQRERAARALGRALELWPQDPRLLAARHAMGTRSAPVIPFLSRSNPLNRVLGRLRHRWAQRNVPAYELSPEALGMPLATDPPPREER
jgi:cytochrome c-type biogenesis protein CcmH/NrfG